MLESFIHKLSNFCIKMSTPGFLHEKIYFTKEKGMEEITILRWWNLQLIFYFCIQENFTQKLAYFVKNCH